MTIINNWTSRDDVYSIMQNYPNAICMTKLSQGDAYWIITKEAGFYFLIGSNAKINITENGGAIAIQSLNAQFSGKQADPKAFIWSHTSAQLQKV